MKGFLISRKLSASDVSVPSCYIKCYLWHFKSDFMELFSKFLIYSYISISITIRLILPLHYMIWLIMGGVRFIDSLKCPRSSQTTGFNKNKEMSTCKEFTEMIKAIFLFSPSKAWLTKNIICIKSRDFFGWAEQYKTRLISYKSVWFIHCCGSYMRSNDLFTHYSRRRRSCFAWVQLPEND